MKEGIEQKNGLQTTSLSSYAAIALLLGVCLASLAIYWAIFISTFNLFELYQQPAYDLLAHLRVDPTANIRLLAGFVLLSGLYLLGWRICRTISGRQAWWIVLGGALLAGLVLLYLYPFDAADIFDNIMHGRILGIYHANPFLQVIAQYRQDPFYSYAAWRTAPSAYGPLWELLAGFTARLVGDGIIANILAFKVLPGLFWAGSTGVTALLLRKFAPERALAGTWLIAWNPLVLFEAPGNGHNDIVMVFWILLAVWAVAGRRYTLAILALLAGTLVKYLPVLLIPAAGWIALRSLPDHRRRIRFILITSLASLALIVVLFAPFWHGVSTLNITRRTQMLTTSLPSLIYWNILQPRLGDALASYWVSRVAAILTGLFALWQAWRAGLESTWESFSRASLYTLAFYLLVTCLWFQEWYPVWLVGLAALLPAGLAQYLGLWIGFTGVTKEFIFAPLVFSQRPQDPKPWLELRLSTGTMLLPWLGAWWVLWKSRKQSAHPIDSHLDELTV